MPSRGATLADWLDEQAADAVEASEAEKAREAREAMEENGCSCCCCTGECANIDDAPEAVPTVPAHWEPAGEGVYSFEVITSWYDDGAWFVPEGWECFKREAGEFCPDLKRHESAERVWLRPLPPPVECDTAPLTVRLPLAA
jgi:hypothetical protein